MRTKVYGEMAGGHVALFGTWDPIIDEHEDLYRELKAVAVNQGQRSAVITFDPSAQAQIRGASEWPVFCDCAARLHLQEQCEIDVRVVVELDRQELDLGVEYFLGTLVERIPLEEIWLGWRQSLGSTGLGDNETVQNYCDDHGIRVRRLPPVPVRKEIAEARNFLRAGRIQAAARLLRRPLIWRQPPTPYVGMTWPPGTYLAIPMTHPFEADTAVCPAIPVTLESYKEQTRFAWPDVDVPWLAFTAGPGDVDDAPDPSRA